MKKVLIVLASILMIVSLSACDKPDPIETKDPVNTTHGACTFGEDCNNEDDKNTSELMDWEIIAFKDSIDYITGDMILFYSFDDCPYCKEAIPVLDEVIKENDVKIYYVHTSRDERNAGNDAYDQVYNYFKEVIEASGYDKLYMPSIFFIKDGQVVAYHVGTVDGHNPSEAKMTQAQIDELKDIFIQDIKLIKD